MVSNDVAKISACMTDDWVLVISEERSREDRFETTALRRYPRD